MLGHLLGHAPDELDGALRRQGILKQFLEVFCVLRSLGIIVSDNSEFIPSGFEVKGVGQPRSFKLQQSERVEEPRMCTRLERNHAHRNQIFPFRSLGDAAKLVRHYAAIFLDSDMSANHRFVNNEVLARLSLSLR